MDFPWLERSPVKDDGEARRVKVARDELASRAGTLFRLGFSEAAAIERLTARCKWEYPEPRPDALSDGAIAKLVADTYARRPA